MQLPIYVPPCTHTHVLVSENGIFYSGVYYIGVEASYTHIMFLCLEEFICGSVGNASENIVIT